MLALLGAASMYSCSVVDDPGPLEFIERTYGQSGFVSVEAEDAIHVTITSGEFYEVKARGDRRNIEDLVVDQEGSTLKVRFEDRRNRRHTTYIDITMPSLMHAEFSGACVAFIGGFSDLDVLNLTLSGASLCDVQADAAALHAAVSGASVLRVWGEGQTMKVSLSGASRLRAFTFPVDHAELLLSGASDASVTVADNLEGVATGASKIVYRGNPAVSVAASGESTVRHE